MRSLKTQISLAFMLVVLGTVLLVSVLSNILLSRRFETYVKAQQAEQTASIVDSLGIQYDMASGTWRADAVYALGMQALLDGYIIKVVSGDGAVVWDAENHDMERCRQIMEEVSARMLGRGTYGGFVSPEYPLTQNGLNIGTVTLHYFGPFFYSASDVVFLDALNLLLSAIGMVSLLLSFMAGSLLAKQIARPITKTAGIAKQISSGSYIVQDQGETKTRELNDLMSALNHLARTLASQESIRKRQTADIAHELRTPLTTLGSHLEAMIEGVWEPTTQRLQSCHDEILRLGKLVKDLEHLERAESADPKLEKEALELLSFTQSVCGNFESELANKDLCLTVQGTPSILPADRDSFRSVITNLLSNAIKYTSPGGQIRIEIQDYPQSCVFIMEDDGPGIPQSELPYIFERFYRADKSRNRGTGGAGIGLAIVKSLVGAHRGTVLAQNRTEGGCRFTLTFPKEDGPEQDS